MKQFLLIPLLLIQTAYALNIELKEGDSATVRATEIEALKMQMKEKGVKIESEDARKLIVENRILANRFLSTKTVPEYIIDQATFSVEERLANLLLQIEEKKVEITDEALLSYYKDKEKKYCLDRQLHFYIVVFDDFESALDAYQAYKKRPSKLTEYAKAHNLKVFEDTAEITRLHPQLKTYMEDEKSENYLTPPQKFKKNFILFRVAEFKDGECLPFEKVKNEVRRALVKENRYTFRKQMLQRLKKGAQ